MEYTRLYGLLPLPQYIETSPPPRFEGLVALFVFLASFAQNLMTSALCRLVAWPQVHQMDWGSEPPSLALGELPHALWSLPPSRTALQRRQAGSEYATCAAEDHSEAGELKVNDLTQ